MARQKISRHIHKYMQTQLTHVTVWRCANCNHWMPPYLNGLMEGRKSICWGCGLTFQLDSESLQDEMPTCYACRVGTIETKLGDTTTAINQFINEKLTK